MSVLRNNNRDSGPPASSAANLGRKAKPMKEKDGFFFPNPAQLERMKAPWAKNALPSSLKAVMLISSSGNVEVGLTRTQFETIPFEDLLMANRADQFAKDSVRETKKTALQRAATYMAKAAQDDEGKWNTAPRLVETGFETLVSLRSLIKNTQLLKRNVNTEPDSVIAKNYLLGFTDPICGALMGRYEAMLMYNGDKTTIDLRALLAASHIPYSVFTKLTSSSDIIQSTEHDVSRTLFPKSASKHLPLTIAECRDDEIIGKVLAFPGVAERSATTIRAARDETIWARAVQSNGIEDPALIERYDRQIVNIVGPGPLHLGWAKPVPSRPVNSDTFAGEILQINKENVDFHLGVVPFGKTAKLFWDRAVEEDVVYAAGLQKTIATQASESGIGKSAYRRDTLTTAMYYRVQTLLEGRGLNDTRVADFTAEIIPAVQIPACTGTVFDLSDYDYLNIADGDAKRVVFDQLPTLHESIAKLFLRPVEEGKKESSKKEYDRPAQIRVPREITNEIKEFVDGKLLNLTAAKKYSSYLAGFHSIEMLKKAHIAFASKVEELDLIKALEANPDSDDET